MYRIMGKAREPQTGEFSMIPARFAPLIFSFILSGVMSSLVSGVAILRSVGFHDGLIGLWLGAWIPSWLIAFPIVLVVAPVARRIANRVVN